MNKTILKFICGLSLAVSVISCADFLAEKPKTFLTPDNYFNTEKQMQAAVDGLYSHLGGIFSGEIEVQSSRYNFIEYLAGYAVRPRSATTTSFQYAQALSTISIQSKESGSIITPPSRTATASSPVSRLRKKVLLQKPRGTSSSVRLTHSAPITTSTL